MMETEEMLGKIERVSNSRRLLGQSHCTIFVELELIVLCWKNRPFVP